jgi:hypothetical protein
MGRFAREQDESFAWGRLLIGELAADGIAKETATVVHNDSAAFSSN